MGSMVVLLLAGPIHVARADIPGVVVFDDPGTGSRCDLVNGANAQLVILEAQGELPRQFALITGVDVTLASSLIDDNLDVSFGGQPFGAIRFAEDGDGLATLWWVDALGNALQIDPLTLVPSTTNQAPTDFTEVSCNACDFWDNRADCPDSVPTETQIITQPQDQNACVGEKVSLFVDAVGDNIDSFQWFKNGQALVAATGNILTFDSVDVNDTASYTVDVINVDGSSISSDPALLVVNTNCTTTPSNPGLRLCGPGLASVMGLALLGLVGMKRSRWGRFSTFRSHVGDRAKSS